jgi:xylulokinase
VFPGEAGLLYGTTMVMIVTLAEKPEADQGVMVTSGPVPNMHRAAWGMSASAALTRWFRNNFGQIEQEVEETLGINAYQLLSAQAEQVPPGSEGLVVLPYFAGERGPIWDAQARGLILGLTLSHTRNHIYRALLEGVAYGARHNMDVLAKTGGKVTRIVATGGGTYSRVWTQIVSDVLGMDQEIVAEPMGAAYGDAFLGGYAAGVFTDLTPWRTDWAPETTRVVHNPETKKVYDKYYAVYRKLYEANKDAMHALAQLSA